MKQSIPFEQLIEIKNISPSVTFEVRPFIEQLSTLMVSGDELELKAAIGLEALVFESLSEEIITDVGEEGQLSEEIDDLPGLVGYMVSEGESLWDIGKAFHTTVESIRELNDLETDTLSAGDKLLLMKEIEVLPLSQETPH
jgi:LysM repeat protein